MPHPALSSYAFQLAYAKQLVADVPDENITNQPFPGANHPAWVLGHLVASAGFCCSMLGLDAEIPDGWDKLFGMNSTPTPDRTAYPPKQQLLDALEQQHARFAQAFDAANPATLAAEVPNEMIRQIQPTIGQALIFFATTHEAIHLGQLSAWRRALGLPRVGP